MPQLAWAADLHLDHASRKTRAVFLQALSDLKADALVLAGDVGTAVSIVGLLEAVAQAFNGPTYFVAGNHDFYGGSVIDVREHLAALATRHTTLTYLWDSDVVALSETTALVGVDGWGDARAGHRSSSLVELTDFRLISELARTRGRAELTAILQALGDESASRLRPRLEPALHAHQHVVIATHVPPFREAALHEGAPSDDEWAPFFVCQAVGHVLVSAAEQHPDRRLLVLCGHTHDSADVWILPNLRVVAAAAEYGAPRFPDVLALP